MSQPSTERVTHSPGPWTIESDADTFEFDIKADGFYVAAIPDVPGHTQANARLIAAAPDLLAAAKQLHDDDINVADAAWVALRAAIAKAEGRE